MRPALGNITAFVARDWKPGAIIESAIRRPGTEQGFQK
jgi:hypothetical protein